MTDRIIRVGIAGYGLAGSVFHAPLIRDCGRMQLTGVLTSREAPHRVSSLDELIEQSDLIVVASPNATHFRIAKQALEAGRHVVVDKPFTVSVAEADALIEMAAQQKRVLSVFHNRRWDSDYLTLRNLLPRIDDISLFEAQWDRYRPGLREGWKEAADGTTGVLIDLGPHLIDQVLQLFGVPESLSADIAAQRPGSRIDDYFELVLHYGERRVCLRSSTLVAAPRPRFAVHGTGGSFVKFGLDPQESQLKAGLDPRDSAYGVDPQPGTFIHPDGSTETVPSVPGNYLVFYEAIADAILDGGPVPVIAEDARDGIALIDLARDAARQGRRLLTPAASSPAS